MEISLIQLKLIRSLPKDGSFLQIVSICTNQSRQICFADARTNVDRTCYSCNTIYVTIAVDVNFASFINMSLRE